MRKILMCLLILSMVFMYGCGNTAPVESKSISAPSVSIEPAPSEPVSVPVDTSTPIAADVNGADELDSDLEDTDVDSTLDELDSVLEDW